MKLYVDDIREAPEGYTLARTISEAVVFIYNYSSSIKEISLDHDISHNVRVGDTYRPFPSPETFATIAYFIGEVYKDEGSSIPKIVTHTANPVGAEKIRDILDKYGIPVEIKLSTPAHRK